MGYYNSVWAARFLGSSQESGHSFRDRKGHAAPFLFPLVTARKVTGMSKKNPTVIPAVAYCRKSTTEDGYEKSIADQKARIRKLKPPADNTRYEVVRWYEKDAGVPGWKRGANRPDYAKLVSELKETGAKAILVDDMDRFSRADPMETVHDVQSLREKGVRFLHACNQGCRDLTADGGMVAMQIAMEANASHEFSTRLSRRITAARLDAAKHGKRSGGEAPYGLENDGKGGLKHGDPKQIKIVRWVFEQFATCLKSMNSIAAALNKQKIPARHGGIWYVATIKEMLQRREYRGDFSYNRKKSGEFHIVNSKHEIERVSRYPEKQRQPWKATDEGAFLKEGIYKPLIDRKLFDAAQKRLAEFALKGSRRPRADGYPLTGILICDHCGKPMYGCRPTGRDYRVYRCSTPAKSGVGTCGTYEIREELILPIVLRKLGEEIQNVTEMLSRPPENLVHPNKERVVKREQILVEREALKQKISQGEENILFVKDARTRQSMDTLLTVLRNQLEKYDAELSTDEKPIAGWSPEDAEALGRWWEEFDKRAVSVPVPGELHPVTSFWQDPSREDQALLIDARVVNEKLHTIGMQVRLRWRTERVTLRNGKQQNRYSLICGRLRLGQRTERVSFRKVPPSAACSGRSGANRRGSRRGTD
jgi:DNA invertase Pin-like site-specific DNA recombinase